MFIVKKNLKSTRAWPILKSIIHHFDLFFYPRMDNTNFTKRGPVGAMLLFLYEVSMVVLIDFIAILLTPGIFSIQTVNTNMYLIHFHSKIKIKMRFPKCWVWKFQNHLRHSLSIGTRWNKLRWQQQRLQNNCTEPDFQQKSNNYYRYFSEFWQVFW